MIFHKNNIRGFSLVELSVVLIILGLLAAGITAGNSLVKGSKYRSIVSEFNSFKTAVTAFELQYDALPGDIPNAYDFWGSSDCTNAIVNNTNANNKACNGNNDGKIEHSTGEGVNAWEHLSLADLIPGSYPGYFTTGGQSDVGINVPASKWKPAGYSFTYDASTNNNSIDMGGQFPLDWNHDPIFTPRDVSTIDRKMDDDVPRTGLIRANNGNAGVAGCINSAETAYNLNLETEVCLIFYSLDGPITN